MEEPILGLTGLTVKTAIRTDYKVRIEFTDGTVLEATGHTFEDCDLDVEVTFPTYRELT